VRSAHPTARAGAVSEQFLSPRQITGAFLCGPSLRSPAPYCGSVFPPLTAFCGTVPEVLGCTLRGRSSAAWRDRPHRRPEDWIRRGVGSVSASFWGSDLHALGLRLGRRWAWDRFRGLFSPRSGRSRSQGDRPFSSLSPPVRIRRLIPGIVGYFGRAVVVSLFTAEGAGPRGSLPSEVRFLSGLSDHGFCRGLSPWDDVVPGCHCCGSLMALHGVR
jgi:hypothetical protein